MASTIQRSFAAGEIGPTLYGGADRARYNAALATCRNFQIMRHGGATNRSGTQYVGEVKTSSLRTYLLKFVYNDTDTYIIEAGNQYFRFYHLGAQVATGSVTAWSGATAYVVGDIASSAGTNYYCILGHTNHQPANGTYWYALTSTILEIPTPYVTADLARLKIVQSGDIVTITHPTYAPRELRRYSSRWTLTAITTAPTLAAPASLAATEGTAGDLVYNYKVTAVRSETYEESVGSIADNCSCTAPTDAAPNTLTWTAVSGAVEYNVYLDKDANGVFGFIGIAATNAFNDVGFEPDFSVAPPIPRTLFATTDNYPQTSGYYQQRWLAAGSNTEPEGVKTSRSGSFKNFTKSSPIQDDDAIDFTMAGRKISEVRHLIEVGKLVILTSTGEWVALGDVDGVLRPTAINLKQQSYHGAAHVMPLVVGNRLIYTQARGGIVRDLRFDQSADGYDGEDLTKYAAHLFEGRSIDRMDYQEVPHSIVWCVQDDGTLLGMTYISDLDIYGWHHHDTADGNDLFEDVCVVPETSAPIPGSTARGKEEDAVYVIVKRTINGSTKRYIERFASRRVTDYRLDALFMDCFLTYNGINDGSGTMTLTTGAGWTTADTITVTSNTSFFSAGDVGNTMVLWDPGVGIVRITIGHYTSVTVVTGTPDITVPVSLRSAATVYWSKAVDDLSGLSHLEGETVAVLADGVPLTKVVSSGAISFSGTDYNVIHVGIPITADFETLDLDSDQASIRDKKKNVKSVSVLVEQSRGFRAGPDVNHLRTYTPPAVAADLFDGTALAPTTGMVELNIQSSWEQPGRVFIRQTSPLPLSILAILPNVDLGG